nr:MAG TPA: hypothetical protein [Caudoviricetes sp.]
MQKVTSTKRKGKMMGGGPFPRKEVRARAKPVRRERKRMVSESPNVTLCIMIWVSQGACARSCAMLHTLCTTK